ncbi:cellulase, partial [human gut metagenome]
MMVDPQNGNIIYMGTRLHGLWRSTDKGRSWARVASFPNVSEKLNPVDRAAWGNRGSGIVCVAYDAQGTRDERGTRDIYVAVSLMGRENLFVSHDYGESWQPVGGQPMQYRPTHMVLTGDGQLVLTYGDTP